MPSNSPSRGSFNACISRAGIYTECGSSSPHHKRDDQFRERIHRDGIDKLVLDQRTRLHYLVCGFETAAAQQRPQLRLGTVAAPNWPNIMPRTIPAASMSGKRIVCLEFLYIFLSKKSHRHATRNILRTPRAQSMAHTPEPEAATVTRAVHTDSAVSPNGGHAPPSHHQPLYQRR